MSFKLGNSTAILRRILPHKAPELSATCHDLESVAPEEGLRPRDVMRRHDQDDLGQIQEVNARGTFHHQVVQMSLYPPKGAARPSAMRITWLGESGAGLLQLLNEGEDSQTISQNRQWISLGHCCSLCNKSTRN